LEFKTRELIELIDITSDVESEVQNSGVKEGICIITTPHTCAGLIINENEPGILLDIVNFLDKLVPSGEIYEHNKIDNNADAHLKRTIMGREVVVAVTNGRLDFGPWEQIFYGEFDGKRRKRVLVKIIGD
jgi:secondary thiamine-phosphate synthase enzyme